MVERRETGKACPVPVHCRCSKQQRRMSGRIKISLKTKRIVKSIPHNEIVYNLQYQYENGRTSSTTLTNTKIIHNFLK